MFKGFFLPVFEFLSWFLLWNSEKTSTWLWTIPGIFKECRRACRWRYL